MARDIVKRELPCKLTAEEVEEREAQLSENAKQLVSWEDERKAVLLPIDTQGKALKQARRKLCRALQDGEEIRQVECMWHERGSQRVLIRVDTDEVVDQEPLPSKTIRDDRQASLPLEEPTPPVETPPAPPADGPSTALATTGPRCATIIEGEFEPNEPSLADDVQRLLRQHGPLSVERLCVLLGWEERDSGNWAKVQEALRRCGATSLRGTWHLPDQIHVLPERAGEVPVEEPAEAAPPAPAPPALPALPPAPPVAMRELLGALKGKLSCSEGELAHALGTTLDAVKAGLQPLTDAKCIEIVPGVEESYYRLPTLRDMVLGLVRRTPGIRIEDLLEQISVWKASEVEGKVDALIHQGAIVVRGERHYLPEAAPPEGPKGGKKAKDKNRDSKPPKGSKESKKGNASKAPAKAPARPAHAPTPAPSASSMPTITEAYELKLRGELRHFLVDQAQLKRAIRSAEVLWLGDVLPEFEPRSHALFVEVFQELASSGAIVVKGDFIELPEATATPLASASELLAQVEEQAAAAATAKPKTKANAGLMREILAMVTDDAEKQLPLSTIERRLRLWAAKDIAAACDVLVERGKLAQHLGLGGYRTMKLPPPGGKKPAVQPKPAAARVFGLPMSKANESARAVLDALTVEEWRTIREQIGGHLGRVRGQALRMAWLYLNIQNGSGLAVGAVVALLTAATATKVERSGTHEMLAITSAIDEANVASSLRGRTLSYVRDLIEERSAPPTLAELAQESELPAGLLASVLEDLRSTGLVELGADGRWQITEGEQLQAAELPTSMAPRPRRPRAQQPSLLGIAASPSQRARLRQQIGEGAEDLVEHLINVCVLARVAALSHGDSGLRPAGPKDSKGRLPCYGKYKGTVDFIGTLISGRAVHFEVKHTSNLPVRWPLKELEDHQAEYLAFHHRFHALCLVVIVAHGGRAPHGGVFAVPWPIVEAARLEHAKGGRASLSAEQLEPHRCDPRKPFLAPFLSGEKP